MKKVNELRAPDSSPSHCFEGRHSSRGGRLASEDSQVGLVLLCRVKDVKVNPPSAQQLAPGEAAGAHQVVPAKGLSSLLRLSWLSLFGSAPLAGRVVLSQIAGAMQQHRTAFDKQLT